MSQQTFNNPVIVYPILNGDISSGAAISASKLQQQRVALVDFGNDRSTAPSASERTVFVALASGSLVSFGAGLADTGTSTDIDFDLKVNGASVLTAVVNVTDAESDDTLQSGVITSTAIAAGDVISIDMSIVSSTGALGPMAQLYWNESPQS